MKIIISFIAAIMIIACTIGVSHKIIVNDYSDTSVDTVYNKKTKNYNINIVNYPSDTVKLKHSKGIADSVHNPRYFIH